MAPLLDDRPAVAPDALPHPRRRRPGLLQYLIWRGEELVPACQLGLQPVEGLTAQFRLRRAVEWRVVLTFPGGGKGRESFGDASFWPAWSITSFFIFRPLREEVAKQ
jgi:hypothetical protein